MTMLSRHIENIWHGLMDSKEEEAMLSGSEEGCKRPLPRDCTTVCGKHQFSVKEKDRDKAEVFNAFFAFVFNIDDGPRGSLSALSWRTMTAKIINSQSSLKSCRICCSSWIPTNLWGLMGFIPESSKSF
ncbi:hypothetical protein BTVI_48233 [Pitangus sulphuratus]|nr:hypothetical protein BTVI_48233 [Pitangus sulphuratus]